MSSSFQAFYSLYTLCNIVGPAVSLVFILLCSMNLQVSIHLLSIYIMI